MTPSLHEIGALAGENVRVIPEFLPNGSNPRQVFNIVEAPIAPHFGVVVLRGKLTGEIIQTNSKANLLTEKVK